MNSNIIFDKNSSPINFVLEIREQYTFSFWGYIMESKNGSKRMLLKWPTQKTKENQIEFYLSEYENQLILKMNSEEHKLGFISLNNWIFFSLKFDRLQSGLEFHFSLNNQPQKSAKCFEFKEKFSKSIELGSNNALLINYFSIIYDSKEEVKMVEEIFKNKPLYPPNSGKKYIDQSHPIKSLDELLKFKGGAEDRLNVSALAPLESTTKRKDGVELIVCHDYKGGYLGDKYCGGNFKENSQNEYFFVDWSFVDIFIYFSHNFITIPPVVWVDSSHLHHTKILGTLITEWNEELTIEMLKKSKMVIEKLVLIANLFKLDGWFLNIETKLSKKEDVSDMIEFIKSLKVALSPKKLIWYDSVTIDGELKWQNQLNEKNLRFFQACDAIFLNYFWKGEEELKGSISYSGNDRKKDVFVGIDIFGRGSYGGGGFNTCDALQLISKYKTSVALFATGWTHEQNYKDYLVNEFREREKHFWFGSSFFHSKNLVSNGDASDSLNFWHLYPKKDKDPFWITSSHQPLVGDKCFIR